MSELTNLKNCAHCDGQAERNTLPGHLSPTNAPVYTVSCIECGASTGGYHSEAEADEAWNKRAKVN